MDEGAAGVNRDSVHALGDEVAHVRDELDVLLGELDRRRHEALDVPLQLRRHATGVGVTVLALTFAAAGSVWLTMWRRRRRARLSARMGRLSQAITRMTERPERVAAEPTIPAKIFTAAANAAVAMLVKKLLEQGFTRLANARGDDTPTATAPVQPDGAQVGRGLQRFANRP